ncbi:MAG: hypothetical protein PHC64_04045 [Candidatus Gastranaerophilales bacterium]|nr:hypothetical protein [Candidatus Gastranaerophilales bacterium]
MKVPKITIEFEFGKKSKQITFNASGNSIKDFSPSVNREMKIWRGWNGFWDFLQKTYYKIFYPHLYKGLEETSFDLARKTDQPSRL